MTTETHWKQNFDYKYTGAYELKPGETKTLTIKRLCNEEVMSTSGQKQLCFVAYFDAQEKPMVLNKTNCKTITKLYGPYIEVWIGKQIIIESKKVKAFGEEVDALRVKNSFPKTLTASEIETAKEKLSECKTLEQLKTVFLSLSKELQAATNQTKDTIKTTLSGGAK